MRGSRTYFHPRYVFMEVNIKTAETGGYVIVMTKENEERTLIADDFDELQKNLKKFFDNHEDMFAYKSGSDEDD